jgi:transketolase
VRKAFCDALVARSSKHAFVFLTGDLGFMALEPLRDALGERFINAGVAEQNMMSVSAGLAGQGLEVWTYSIAPFTYARPFEQIRNDIAFHRLPVKLVGNGGGYAYGVMGPTHHAIEDYGVLLTLPGMRAFVPCFDEDIEAVVELAGAAAGPIYLRLGRGEAPPSYTLPAYAPWRQLTDGEGPVCIAVGPLAGAYVAAFDSVPFARRPRLWAVSELPIEANPLPSELLRQIADASRVIVAEEHVRQGGFAADLALSLSQQGVPLRSLQHFCARRHVFERYGSQAYLRKQSGLDAESVLCAI